MPAMVQACISLTRPHSVPQYVVESIPRRGRLDHRTRERGIEGQGELATRLLASWTASRRARRIALD
jgi:hypothetical protein